MCCEDFSLFFLTPTPDTATSFYSYYQTPFCQCGNIIIRTENGAEDDSDLIWVWQGQNGPSGAGMAQVR